MEKGSQLSKLKQEKRNLEQAALDHTPILKHQEKEEDVKDVVPRQVMDEMVKTEVQKLQDRYADRISQLEKEKKSLEQELKSLSSNEARLKKEITTLESKTRESKSSETRLIKDISALQEKVRFNLYK